MAALDLQEQEQIDALKHFWSRYGASIALGVIALCVGYGGIYGWKAWQNSKANHAAEAFVPFADASKVEKPDVKKLGQLADQLARDYASSVYAAQAALSTASSEFEAGDTASAQKRLQWVLVNNKDEAVLAVTRLRLAALLLDTGKPDEATQILQGEHPAEFDSLFAESRGDVLASKKQVAQARLAYISAQAKAEPERKMLLDLKLQALGG